MALPYRKWGIRYEASWDWLLVLVLKKIRRVISTLQSLPLPPALGRFYTAVRRVRITHRWVIGHAAGECLAISAMKRSP